MRSLSFFVLLGASLCALGWVASPVAAAECVWGNCQNGHGTLRYPDGRMERGIWKEGELVRSLGGGRALPPAGPGC